MANIYKFLNYDLLLYFCDSDNFSKFSKALFSIDF